jgi:hypothetical protein
MRIKFLDRNLHLRVALLICSPDLSPLSSGGSADRSR